LVATLVVMSLVAILAVGLLSLSTIELRRSKSGDDLAAARANARLALMHAIGQLQVELGPDQRVSATSGILGTGTDPNWTGVWSTRRDDGSSYWSRDAVSGSLIDLRG
jgi:type II secretory pathway pseudopilin PulG